jgi:hypothetical protein
VQLEVTVAVSVIWDELADEVSPLKWMQLERVTRAMVGYEKLMNFDDSPGTQICSWDELLPIRLEPSVHTI